MFQNANLDTVDQIFKFRKLKEIFLNHIGLTYNRANPIRAEKNPAGPDRRNGHPGQNWLPNFLPITR